MIDRENPLAVFFVTTARSATQWLADSLSRNFPDELVVAHEALGYAYAPRRTLRDPEAQAALLQSPLVAAHLDGIREVLASGRSYVEVGFPVFAMAPALQEVFGDRLRLVQLTRDPLRVAASLVTHRWYVGEGREDVRDTVALTPFDPGARLAGYAERWALMTPFEKGLYYWAEVHAYGRELEAGAPPGGFARFRAEDLVAEEPGAREALRLFLDLPERPDWREGAQRARVDRHRATTTEPIDVRQARLHPEIVALARRFGYAPLDLDAPMDAPMAARYGANPGLSVRRRVRRAVRRLSSFFFH